MLPPRSTTAMTIVSRPIATAAPVMALVTSAAVRHGSLATAHWARAGRGASRSGAHRHAASAPSRSSHRDTSTRIPGDRTVPAILAQGPGESPKEIADGGRGYFALSAFGDDVPDRSSRILKGPSGSRSFVLSW